MQKTKGIYTSGGKEFSRRDEVGGITAKVAGSLIASS